VNPFVSPTVFEPGDAALGRPPLPPGRSVELDGRGTTFVREVAGPPGAPTVILLHGWTVTGALNWFRLYKPISEFANVISIDHRGHGQGIRPNKPFKLRDAADDVVALADVLGLDKVVLVGYSMGGPIAQLVARHYPHRVSGLVLSATWASGPSDARSNRLLRLSGVAGRGLSHLSHERQLKMVNYGFKKVSGTDPTDRPSWFVNEVAAASMPMVVQAGTELTRFDSRAWLHELAMPAGIVITTHDRAVPPGRQHELASLLPHADLGFAPVDHDGCITEADRYNPGFLKVLKQVMRVDSGSGRPAH